MRSQVVRDTFDDQTDPARFEVCGLSLFIHTVVMMMMMVVVMMTMGDVPLGIYFPILYPSVFFY